MSHIQRLKHKFFKVDGGMLGPDEKDVRDFNIGLFGWGSYKPRKQRVLLPTITIKDQIGRNTCTFESAVAQKEMDEGKPLSVRSAVIYARKQGYIKGDGFSSLRKSQKVITDYGALDYGVINENKAAWQVFSRHASVFNRDNTLNAARNKSKTFWGVDRINDIYKQLDAGKAVQTAMWWYTGYNRSGGFDARYPLPYRKGIKVGAHAVLVVGYDQDFYGDDVIIFQNSFGPKWGDSGLFYMTKDTFMKELGVFGGYAQMDLDKKTSKFILRFDNKIVKTSDKPAVFYIQAGKKRHVVDVKSFYNSGFKSQDLHIVHSDQIKLIPQGKDIKLNTLYEK